MNMDTIVLRVTRALCMNAERIEPGTTLKLTPLAAAEVLASGRAELVHLADAEACRKAVRDDVARVLKAERRGQIAPAEGWPWRAT